MPNQQPISKRVKDPFAALSVIDIFYTIQGEGVYAGFPAVFVRLAGCNLQCPHCDTDYTTGAFTTGHASLAKRIENEHKDATTCRPLVVITGGEPLRQNIAPLLYLLRKEGYPVQIETNGSFPPPDVEGVDYICSPKTGKVNKQLQPYIRAYKYVLKAGEADTADGLPVRALDHPAAPKLARPHDWDVPIFVQPLDSDTYEDNVKACIDTCMRHGYILSLQLHKILNLP